MREHEKKGAAVTPLLASIPDRNQVVIVWQQLPSLVLA